MISLKSFSICTWIPYVADLQKHRCGYCKNEVGSATRGMWAESLTVADYQALIDRGWRRSGRYLYKPVMEETCCPQYTIRCDIMNFSMSKSQKKVVKKFNKFVNIGEISKSSSTMESMESCEPEGANDFFLMKPPTSNVPLSKVEHCENLIEDHEKLPSTSTSGKSIQKDKVAAASSVLSETKLPESSSFKKGIGADPSKVPCKKAKLLRMEHKQKKLQEKGVSAEKPKANNAGKDLEQLLKEISDNPLHKLKTKLVCNSKPGVDWETVENIEYELFKKYQLFVHNDESTLPKFRRFLVDSPLRIKLKTMTKNSESFRESAQLFNKYQRIVHNDKPDDCDADQFYDFLVETPLEHVDFEDDSGLGYGSFHQQYWIDDKLIAVGVIDILPKCVTSVYFFYDPDYRNLTLGTYGSLKEIGFTRQINALLPEIKYYYLGYYIHNCPKMRYKGKLKPSFLLCPETYQWFPIETCLPKLDINKYSRLNEDLDAVDTNLCSPADANNIKILFRNQLRLLKSTPNADREDFEIMGNYIGKDALKNIIIYLQY